MKNGFRWGSLAAAAAVGAGALIGCARQTAEAPPAAQSPAAAANLKTAVLNVEGMT